MQATQTVVGVFPDALKQIPSVYLSRVPVGPVTNLIPKMEWFLFYKSLK